MLILGSKPKILIVAKDKYPPFRVDVVDLFSANLSKAYKLVWLMNAEQPGPNHIVHTEDEDFFVIGRSNGRGRQLKNHIKTWHAHLAMLRRVLRSEFDVVQCRDVMLLAPLYALAARRVGAVFCYWMSFPMEDSFIERGRMRIAEGGLGALFAGWGRITYGHLARWTLYRCTLPIASAVFVQSRRMKKDVVSMGIEAAKVHPVPMGVNVEKYDGAIRQLPDAVYGDRKVVLYVGTLELARQMEVPGRGVAMAMQKHPDMVFAVIGRHKHAEIERLMGPFVELGVADRVRFFSHMPLDELFRHVRRADVCLAPYPEQPRMMASATPTKTIEYVYLGGMIVANRHPDQEEVLTGAQCGVLTDFSAQGFADGIERALSCSREPDTAVFMAQWVRDNRSYKALAEGVSRVYNRLITDSGPGI